MTGLEEKLEALLGDVPKPATPITDTADRGVFRREGEYWSVGFNGEAFRLRDTKGLGYLAKLLAQPGTEMHVLDLVGIDGGSRATAEDGLEVGGLGDAGEVLDPEARAAYRQRLLDLAEELERAEEWNDPERASLARQEIEFLTKELSGAEGLGGRSRRAASPAERARVNVTRAIRTAMARVAENDGNLGRHLDTTVQTGTFCAYTPDPRSPIDWQL